MPCTLAPGAGALVCAVPCTQPVSQAATAGRASRRRKARGMPGILSIVAPLYNEEGNVTELVRRLGAVASTIEGFATYELVLVNDGSTDRTRELLREHAARDPHLVIVELSRNFGHQIAATAGLDIARGDPVVLIDADLQDPPELIPELVARWREGYDVVYAVRRNRKGESPFKLFTARLFYRVIRRLTNVDIPVDSGDFRLFSRRVVDALKSIRERHRFIRGLVSWVGYRQSAIAYDRDARFSGATKYPVSKMLRFAVDGITSFSDIPLRVATWFGFVVSAVAFGVALAEIAIRIFTGYNLPGYTSTIFAILFLGGVQLIGIGILGEYVGRIHDEVKGRPLYLLASVERDGQIAQQSIVDQPEVVRTL
jgi:dolichol-phosphate mannosyltransferase